jgi:hypothetical protein
VCGIFIGIFSSGKNNLQKEGENIISDQYIDPCSFGVFELMRVCSFTK